MMATEVPFAGACAAPPPARPAATGSGSGDSDPALAAAAAAAGSPDAKPVPCTTERCRLCGLLRLVFDVGMFKHYCHPCSCIRQRGYKRGLTLRDLRVAMRVHGPTHGVNDFLDLAVDTKAAQTALGRDAATGGAAADADAAADEAEAAVPPYGGVGGRRKRPGGGEGGPPGAGPGTASGMLSDAQETALQERMTAELLAAGLRSQVRHHQLSARTGHMICTLPSFSVFAASIAD